MLLEHLIIDQLLNEDNFSDRYYDYYKNQFYKWWDKVSPKVSADMGIYKVLRFWFLNNHRETLFNNNKLLKLEAAGRKAIEWLTESGSGKEHAQFLKLKFKNYGIAINSKPSQKKNDNIIYIKKPEAKFDLGKSGYVVKSLFVKDGWALVKFSHWFNKKTREETFWSDAKHGERGNGEFAIIQVPENVKEGSKIFLEGNGLADYSLGEIDIHTIHGGGAYFTSGHQLFDKSDRYAAKEAKQFFAFIIRNKPELLPWFKIVRDKKTGKLKIKEK